MPGLATIYLKISEITLNQLLESPSNYRCINCQSYLIITRVSTSRVTCYLCERLFTVGSIARVTSHLCEYFSNYSWLQLPSICENETCLKCQG